MSGKCLVDTNVIIRLLQSDERSIELFDQADSICISAIVAGELFYGAQKSSRRQENIDIFSDFLSQYELIEIDFQIAQLYGEIIAQLIGDGINIPENDLWIAATAKFYQFTLISFDAHFSKIDGLNVLS